jgi:transcriptional regulator with XRE-family HTH domain
MKRTDPEKIKSLEKLVAEGISTAAAARMLNMGVSTAQIWMRAYRRGFDSSSGLIDYYARQRRRQDGKRFKNAAERHLSYFHDRGIRTNTELARYYARMRGFRSHDDYQASLLPPGETKYSHTVKHLREKLGYSTVRAYRKETPAVKKAGGITAYEKKQKEKRSKRPENRIFSRFLRDKVQTSNLSGAQLAKMIGVERNTLYAYKQGAILPRHGTAMKIFQFCGVRYISLRQFFEDPSIQRKYGAWQGSKK